MQALFALIAIFVSAISRYSTKALTCYVFEYYIWQYHIISWLYQRATNANIHVLKLPFLHLVITIVTHLLLNTVCLSLSSPEVHWAEHVSSFCPRPDTKVSRAADENSVFMYKLINNMLIWHSRLPTLKWLLIDQYSLIFHPFTSGNVFLKVTLASWIMKEESSLFHWFNGSGPSCGLLTGSKKSKAPIHTHTFIS